jgi:hypothetical protein
MYEVVNTETGQVWNRGTWYASKELGHIYHSKKNAQAALRRIRRKNNQAWYGPADIRYVTW